MLLLHTGTTLKLDWLHNDVCEVVSPYCIFPTSEPPWQQVLLLHHRGSQQTTHRWKQAHISSFSAAMTTMRLAVSKRNVWGHCGSGHNELMQG